MTRRITSTDQAVWSGSRQFVALSCLWPLKFETCSKQQTVNAAVAAVGGHSRNRWTSCALGTTRRQERELEGSVAESSGGTVGTAQWSVKRQVCQVGRGHTEVRGRKEKQVSGRRPLGVLDWQIPSRYVIIMIMMKSFLFFLYRVFEKRKKDCVLTLWKDILLYPSVPSRGTLLPWQQGISAATLPFSLSVCSLACCH